MNIWNRLQGIEFRQTFVDAAGIRTRSLEAGSPDNPPLVLLHGTGGHAEAYLANLAELSQHFHVHALDLVGHGYSDAPDIDYGMQHYVDHLLSYFEAKGFVAAYLSGESMGSSVSVWFANRYPERVSRLILNTGLPLAPDEQGKRQLRDVLQRAKKASGTPSNEAIRDRMLWLFHDASDLTDELVECRLKIYQQPGRAEILARISQQAIGGLIDPANESTWQNPENLTRLDVPTLVLWTRHNPGQPVTLAERGVSLIPDAKLVILENSSHWPQWEEPEAFNRAVIDFLKS